MLLNLNEKVTMGRSIQSVLSITVDLNWLSLSVSRCRSRNEAAMAVSMALFYVHWHRCNLHSCQTWNYIVKKAFVFA